MNAFRQLLKAAGGHPPVGTWIMSASPLVAEAIGHAGFDWGVIDMEHAPLDLMEVVHLLQAVGRTKMVPVVRVPWNDAVIVKRVLDAGATTLLFPFVQNADEAARAVAATRYPPEGVRGMAGMSRAIALRHGAELLRAPPTSSVGVIVQLETRAGGRAARGDRRGRRRRRAVHRPGRPVGLDGPCRPAHAPGGDGADGAGRAALQGDRQAGGHDRRHDPESVAQYRATGFDYVAVGSDLGLFMQGAQVGDRRAAHARRRPRALGVVGHSGLLSIGAGAGFGAVRALASAHDCPRLHRPQLRTPRRRAAPGPAPRPRRLHRRLLAPRARRSCAAPSRSR